MKNSQTNWQRLESESIEHYELFVSYCEFPGTVKEWYETIKPKLTIHAIQKIASPARNNWQARKKAFIQYSSSKQAINVNEIKDNLLQKLNELTTNTETLNITNIEILTNCFYKLYLIDCETKKEISIANDLCCESAVGKEIEVINLTDITNAFKQSNKTNQTLKENATVSKETTKKDISTATVDNRPLQLEKENNKHFDWFCKFVGFAGSVADFAKTHSKEFDVSVKTIREVAKPFKNNWLERKKQYLDSK